MKPTIGVNMLKFMNDYSYQAFRLLQVCFVVAPILAGIDKFFNFLTNWSQYLSPLASQTVHGHDHAFMMAVGVVEIIAGIGALLKPKLFAYIIALWLLGIIIILVMSGHYYDIALRDLGLMLAALAFGRLSQKYDASYTENTIS
jgi:hypothetical protein